MRGPRPKPLPANPRRIRGGIKLAGGVIDGPTLWAGQRWMRLVESAAQGAALAEGLEYVKLGQTKRLTTTAGRVEAHVQGRESRPYVTVVSIPTFSEAQWEKVLGAMAEGAIYAAKLLAGELPANIEDVFGPQGLRLFPTEAADVTVSCTCADHKRACEPSPPAASARPESPSAPGDPRWCKHLCCLSYLFAQRLATEPFLMLAIRGIESADLLERLRERRVVVTATPGSRLPVYVQHVAGIADAPSKPLEACVASFWDAGPELAEVETPIEKPAVSHPILRRLGPSPFAGSKFPLVGLLASAYDVIGQEALAGAPSPEPVQDSPPESDPESPES